jgi:cholesterol transport system auxiliary component
MKTLSASLLVLVLSGCNFWPKSAAVHDFGLIPLQPNSTKVEQHQVPEITVDAPRWLSTSRIYYRLVYAAPTQLRYYAMDQWIAPPPELFQQLLLAKGIAGRRPVNVNLRAFEQQFPVPGRATAVMVFSVSIVDDAAKITKEREFHLQRLCHTPDAKGAVAAFAELTKQAAAQVRAWLDEGHTGQTGRIEPPSR